MQKQKDLSETLRFKSCSSFHFINLLDKCKQIPRDDNIWIRNKIKAGDHDIIQIFASFKKQEDIQTLQVKLRRHITNFKNKVKTEQLTKLKQNLQITKLLHSKPQHNIRLSYNPKNQQQNEIKNQQTTKLKLNCSSQINLRGNSSERTLIFSKTNKQLIPGSLYKKHHRIKSEDKINISFRKPIRQQTPKSFTSQVSMERSILKNQKTIQVKNEQVPITQMEQKNTSQKNNDHKQDFICVEQYLRLHAYNGIQMTSSYVPQTSKNQIQSKKQEHSEVIRFQYDNENIFTPSQLLNQCRNFLKRNKNYENKMDYNQFEQSVIDSNIPKCMKIDMQKCYNLNQSNLASCNLNFSNFQIQKIKSRSISELLQESKLIRNQDSSTITEQQFSIFETNEEKKYDRQTRTRHYSELGHLNSKRNTAEQVIDAIKYHVKNGIILVSQIISVIPSDLLWQFKESFINSGQNITVNELGVFLEKRMAKSGDNQVKYLHRVLDTDNKEYITLKDVQNIIKQLKTHQIGLNKQIPQKMMKFYNNGCNSDGKLYYWNSYTIKHTPQFLDICEVLYQLKLKQDV